MTNDSITHVCISPDGAYALLREISKGDGVARLWVLDWELEARPAADWDEAVRPYLTKFLSSRVPYGGTLPVDREPTEEEITRALTRGGKPSCREQDFKQLLFLLGCAGFGRLRPEGILRELRKMAASWTEPKPKATPS